MISSLLLYYYHTEILTFDEHVANYYLTYLDLIFFCVDFCQLDVLSMRAVGGGGGRGAIISPVEIR
jgi:hypothetical protein